MGMSRISCFFSCYRISGNFSRLESLAKKMHGRCVNFSLSLILAFSRTLNEDV